MGNNGSHLDSSSESHPGIPSSWITEEDGDENLFETFTKNRVPKGRYRRSNSTETVLHDTNDEGSNISPNDFEKILMTNSKKNCWNLTKHSSLSTFETPVPKQDAQDKHSPDMMVVMEMNEKLFINPENERKLSVPHCSTSGNSYNHPACSTQASTIRNDETSQEFWTEQDGDADALHLGKSFLQLLNMEDIMDRQGISSAGETLKSISEPESTTASSIFEETVQQEQITAIAVPSTGVNETISGNGQASYEEILSEAYPKISKSFWNSFKSFGVPLNSLISLNTSETIKNGNSNCIPSTANASSESEDNHTIPVLRLKGGAVVYRNPRNSTCKISSVSMNSQKVQPTSDFATNSGIVPETSRTKITSQDEENPKTGSAKRSFSEAFEKGNAALSAPLVPLDNSWHCKPNNCCLSSV